MTVEDMIRNVVAPDAEYTAAAGPDHGWVKVWANGGHYLVYWGNNAESYAIVDDDVDLEDLASYLEDDTMRGLEAIVQTANIRGADAVTPAAASDEGPFYILKSRHWYGATETSSLVMDDRGEPLAFETLRAARAWIERADSEVYYLAHGEYARPSYKVVAAQEPGA